MRWGPIALTVLVSSFACSTSGCGDDSAARTAGERNPSIAAVIKGLDNPFFGTMRDGLVATARGYDTPLGVEAAADQDDAAGQAARLDSRARDRAGCYI